MHSGLDEELGDPGEMLHNKVHELKSTVEVSPAAHKLSCN